MDFDEKKIIKQCIAGNHSAQKVLYHHFSKKLYGICLRYAPNPEDAQDILQDGFLKIYSKLETFKHQGSFEGWLRRIISNTAIEHYRKKVDLKDIEDIESSAAFSIIDDQNLEVQDILEIIQQMPNGYRMVFNMYGIEGYSHAEIAAKLNISEGTSKSQLARARAHIQKKLEQKNKINLNIIQPLLLFTRLLY